MRIYRSRIEFFAGSVFPRIDRPVRFHRSDTIAKSGSLVFSPMWTVGVTSPVWLLLSGYLLAWILLMVLRQRRKQGMVKREAANIPSGI